uniref:Mannosylglycerate hydrolase MGH1-like glycoside hydrolase domain-containing protein n=1 Tax=Solibacter usitatus (strain Ellin6076) TaxID=234267 RepID=Q01PD7_SOLUE
MTAEEQRLKEAESARPSWRLWGPYVSERQWGTVREDYSATGEAWKYLTHDAARSRAYRWGEDGLAGICDRTQALCFALALWNGRDPILKERLFGLGNAEGNHGEDVKELYYYLDGTPSHSYLKMLYKYPQCEFPYTRLVQENARRGLQENEYELIDTGAFDGDRYWDVFVEYFKAAPDDILAQISVHNRGPEESTLQVLPQLWFRNTWSWTAGSERPSLAAQADGSIAAQHVSLGAYHLYAEPSHELLFCDNETNAQRLYGVKAAGHFKDAFHEYIVHGNRAAVNPERRGTKAALRYVVKVAEGGMSQIRLRLSARSQTQPFGDFADLAATRQREADEYYAGVQQDQPNPDARLVQRQAFAGMIWSKQFYNYDVRTWLSGDPAQPPPPAARAHGRNSDWTHFNSCDIFSMPDKWEYPWFAAWDLGFQAVTFALIDTDFAKQQLLLLGAPWYMHPNGALPAYEWSFGDANPPVHAWAAWRVFEIDRKQRRQKDPHDPGDLDFLKRILQKQLLTFTWWVNRKDKGGRNLFQGGFLGLDNITVFDRSEPLPTGGYLTQADGTGWMAMFALNLMRMSLELAVDDPVYEDLATKFFEHFLYIAQAMTNMGNPGTGLWNEAEGFFDSALNLPDGQTVPLTVRSMVGLIPLFAVETLEPALLSKTPAFAQRMDWFLHHRPDLAGLVSHWNVPGAGERRLLSLLRGHRMKALLKRMLDPGEFLGDYGVRAVSRYYKAHPYSFEGGALTLSYEPAESRSRSFGGNSNWRGPIWFPVNFLIIESLQKFHHYYGDAFKIECPTGSGQYLTIGQVAEELSKRLCSIFLKNADGRRQVYALYPKLQNDTRFRDYVNFYEYFDGDTGRGVGASHQTGWTGVVAKLLQSLAGNKSRS